MQEQCEADADTSIQQRLLMGAATTIQGTGGALCEEGEGNQDVMIAGGVCVCVCVCVCFVLKIICLLYTSPSPRDATLSRMPSSA